MAADPLPGLVRTAFDAVVEAEKYIYAAGMRREVKDHAIQAHSHLLALKNILREEARR